MRISFRRRLFTALAGPAMIAGLGTAAPAQPGATQFSAALTGANEVPAGDPDGAGTARVRVLGALNQVCVRLEVRGISRATAAHIHRGAAGVNGPPVVNLDPPDNDGDEDDCDRIGDALADEIQANPAGFYVNIHTADFPDGAIRGQLMPSAD
jgi:CHRD domain